MNRSLILLICIILVFSTLPLRCSTPQRGTCVYVSNLGSDENDGHDRNHPLKTISAAIKTGKDIKLRSGDVFYESISLKGQNLSAYGKGAKPKICGWKYLNNAKWENIDKFIWRLNLESNDFSGRTDKTFPFLNDIGLIIDTKTGFLYGLKKQCLYKQDCVFKPANAHMNTWLKDEMDFAQTPNYGKNKLKSSDFNYLYLYSTRNPKEMNLAVSTYGNGITASNSVINGIAIEGFSCHGIAAGSNVKITNCEIKYIGGAQQVGYPLWVRFGNGIEFYISKITENGYVAHNSISYTFDCGTTIQGSKRIGEYPKNIIIEQNKIFNCRQAFEYFLNNDDPNTGENYDCVNCAFRNNICIDNGNNGFGLKEILDAHIISYQNDYISSIKIENNIFIGGSSLYFAIHPENIRFGKGNIYYVTEGTPILRPGQIIYYKGGIKDVYNKLKEKNVDAEGVRLVCVSNEKMKKLIKKYL